MQTPSAPPLPLAATLSPILWRLNSPDRFDMYSVGMLFLQMAFPPLRRWGLLAELQLMPACAVPSVASFSRMVGHDGEQAEFAFAPFMQWGSTAWYLASSCATCLQRQQPGLCTLLPAVLPACSDNNLVAFNRKLQGYNYDLSRWRQAQQRRGSKDLQEGFQVSCAVLASRLIPMPCAKVYAARGARRTCCACCICVSRLLGVGLAGKLRHAAAC